MFDTKAYIKIYVRPVYAESLCLSFVLLKYYFYSSTKYKARSEKKKKDYLSMKTDIEV